MEEVTCSECQGSGKTRRGTVVAPIDPNYDVTRERSTNHEWARRGLALLALAEPGDTLEYNGQFSNEIICVGMYDGWPFWQPTPAALTTGPLGVGDWQFYYSVTGLRKQGTSVWLREVPQANAARLTQPQEATSVGSAEKGLSSSSEVSS